MGCDRGEKGQRGEIDRIRAGGGERALDVQVNVPFMFFKHLFLIR